MNAEQNPHDAVDPQKAETAMINKAKAGGAAAAEFDPNATPEQKAAQMKEVRHLAFKRHGRSSS